MSTNHEPSSLARASRPDSMRLRTVRWSIPNASAAAFVVTPSMIGVRPMRPACGPVRPIGILSDTRKLTEQLTHLATENPPSGVAALCLGHRQLQQRARKMRRDQHTANDQRDHPQHSARRRRRGHPGIETSENVHGPAGLDLQVAQADRRSAEFARHRHQLVMASHVAYGERFAGRRGEHTARSRQRST